MKDLVYTALFSAMSYPSRRRARRHIRRLRWAVQKSDSRATAHAISDLWRLDPNCDAARWATLETENASTVPLLRCVLESNAVLSPVGWSELLRFEDRYSAPWEEMRDIEERLSGPAKQEFLVAAALSAVRFGQVDAAVKISSEFLVGPARAAVQGFIEPRARAPVANDETTTGAFYDELRKSAGRYFSSNPIEQTSAALRAGRLWSAVAADVYPYVRPAVSPTQMLYLGRSVSGRNVVWAFVVAESTDTAAHLMSCLGGGSDTKATEVVPLYGVRGVRPSFSKPWPTTAGKGYRLHDWVHFDYTGFPLMLKLAGSQHLSPISSDSSYQLRWLIDSLPPLYRQAYATGLFDVSGFSNPRTG